MKQILPEQKMTRQKKQQENFEIAIEKLVYGGDGLGRHKGKVIFVPFSVPGDHLLVCPVEERKNFLRAKIVKIIQPAPSRTIPLCPYFSKCGGCHWQQMNYDVQVEAKQRILEETFHHKFPETRGLPIGMRACSHPFGYRSRARIQLRGAGPGASAGFFRCGSHSIEDIETCPLFRDTLNEALSALRQFRLKAETDKSAQEMDIACSAEEDTWATISTEPENHEGISPILGKRKSNEVILHKKAGEFNYSVTASVFFQANDFMISELVQLVGNSIKDSGKISALDLFAGAGLFSLPLARQFENVTAVENAPDSCRFCSTNASAAGFNNLQIVCSDVSEWMHSEETKRNTKAFDLILLDPPRTGAGPEIIKKIIEWSPKTILYVSCDPQTLARDLSSISQDKYKIDLIEGLDMFPQTYHFETVVRLTRTAVSR
jgi:23S rRNA (uracil1939-C5)-methyltransferase